MVKAISGIERLYERPVSRVSNLRCTAGLAAVLTLFLSGCADSPKSPFPSLGSITDLGTVLTPEERQKAIADLHKQDEAKTSPAKDTAKQ